MLIFPAIDVMGGRVVRLLRGDYANSESYGSDPAAFARRFRAAGASHLHLVDLDGAKAGSLQNFDSIQKVAQIEGLYCELGGGIRNAQTVEACFAAGVKRVILGTSALRDGAFTKEMVRQFGDKIAVGVDARDGKVAVEGWLDTSDTDSLCFCKQMRDVGVKAVIYTDISRDGAEKGTNLSVYEQLVSIQGLQITASGGISSLEDIRALKALGVHAAILGKALYTGKIELAAALKLAGE